MTRRSSVALLSLVAITLAGFLLRVAGVWQAVFAGPLVRLKGADPFYHLRQIEQLVRHFPHRMGFDPYALHPGGQETVTAPLFDHMAAALSLLVGLGSPTEATMAAVAALLPPVFGAGLIILTYLLGREVAGRGAGLLAAALVAFLPGPLFLRTSLGFADHHALESLLVAAFALTFLRSLRTGRRALLPGALLALYLLTWSGGALLVLLLALFSILLLHLEALRQRDLLRIARVLLTVLVIPAVVVSLARAGLPGAQFHLIALGIAITAVLAVTVLARLLPRPAFLPFATTALAAGGLAAMALATPDTLPSLWHALSWFSASGLQTTVSEATPLLYPEGRFSLHLAGIHFGLATLLLPLGATLLVRRLVHRHDPAMLFILVWSTGMVLATLGQNRFGYYSTVNVALLAAVGTAWLIGRLFHVCLKARSGPKIVEQALWGAVAVAVLLAPALPALPAAALRHSGPGESWVAALCWLREKSPEPFEDPGTFHRLYAKEQAPVATYSVLSWWDAGWWISQLGRRVPATNPTQTGAGWAARVLTASTEGEAASLAIEQNVRYLILDSKLPLLPTVAKDRVGGRLDRVGQWAGLGKDGLYTEYLFPVPGGAPRRTILFSEAYYRTLAVRLTVFEGEAIPEGPAAVVVWRGVKRKVVSFERFDSHRAAQRRLEELSDPRARIVSTDPLVSCVSLPAVRSFRRVFASRHAHIHTEIPEVQVYELVSRE